ncbi:heterokaryon incompatibility protein-domain-containing protein [Pestalotiopsis sp. NC0098]|nr:heterokaryon incompatibility protein-domain-containing protein [Pestalotiopsis sp. NC0098]
MAPSGKAALHSQEKIYSYTSLNDNHFRLLLLEPGSASEPLVGRLLRMPLGTVDCVVRDYTSQQEKHICSITSDDGYFAISYTWGPPEFTEPLYLEGGQIMITRSLNGALRQFRRLDRPIALWADAICINQQDFAERSHQVQRMSTIYAKCQLVLAWLGEFGTSACGVFWLLDRLDKLNQPNSSLASDSRTLEDDECLSELIRVGRTQMSCGACGDQHPRDQDIDGIFKGFNAVLGQGYFKRLWPLQERFIKAPHVQFFAGRHSFEFAIMINGTMSMLGDFVLAVSRRGPPSSALQALISHLRGFNTLIHFRDVVDSMWPGNLLMVILQTAPFLCSNPLDKIYAVRRIADIEDIKDLDPDYSLSPSELWMRTAKTIMRQGNASRECRSVILALAGLRSASDCLSWVPDFGALPSSAYTKAEAFKQYHRGFSAGRPPAGLCGSTGASELQWASEENKNMLSVRGFVLGPILRTLSASQPPVMPWATSRADRLGRLSWFLKCHEFCITTRDQDDGLTTNGTAELLSQGHQKMWHHMGLPRFDVEAAIATNAPKELIHMAREYLSGLPQEAVALDPNDFCNAVVEVEALFTMSSGYPLVLDHDHVLAQTSFGCYGWVPGRAQVGDSVVLLEGAARPFILRQTSDGWYRVVGDAYIQGRMNGEAWPIKDKNMEKIVIG